MFLKTKQKKYTMESEFPDPDEEFELMHAEEMEMLQEDDNFDHDDFFNGVPKAKRSLKFTSSKAVDSFENTLDETTENNFRSVRDENVNISSTASQSIRPLSMDTNSQDPVNTESLLNALDEGPGPSSKRTIDDLFGDIDDINFDDDHISKRSKQNGLTKDEREMLTIETIVFERKRLQEEKLLPRLANSNRRSFKSAKPVYSRTVPRWNFMPLTDKKGERIYARLYTEEEHEKDISEMSSQNQSGRLLSVPFDQLQKMAHEQLQIKWNKIEKNEAKANNQDLEILPALEEELWVEKYKPKSYLELLSDEGTNRVLLQWLKLWDKVVFNRERKVKFKPKEEPKGKFGFKFQKKTGPVVIEDLDEHGRPFHKIALLCGPPGLGKTTLAHMIANQAGYNVVEVNASDDRSPEVFRTQLEAATQMRAVMGAERRPNCLVLDEIDGAPAASIDVVLKFALGKPAGKRKGQPNKKAKNSDKTEILKRPIICICNDVYVPALRPLRQAAFVVYFPPTVPARLGQRLVEIARMQSIKADLGAMMTLSEKTNNDIRSCLALLQCLKVQSGGVVSLSQIHKAAIGQKDLQKGLFTVWQEIFQIPRPKRKTFVEMVDRDTNAQARPELESSESKTSTSTLSERAKSVLRTVQGCGDYERLAQGVFENYLNMKIKDSTMISVANGLKWFCFFDAISSKIHTTQNYILYPYLAYPFVLWHLLYANLSWPKLNYPSTGFEMTSRLQRSTQIVDEVLKSMVPTVRAYTYRETLTLETLPLLLEIIVPNLRPVNISLYSRAEKEELEHMVNIMIDYSLTYAQERTPDAAYIFTMDPNVEEVCRFDGGKGCRSLTYGIRQLVAREVELEKLRRAEASLYRGSLPNPSDTAEPLDKSPKKEPPPPKGGEKKVFKNHLQRLAPKSVKAPDLLTKDFFGRVIDNPEITNQLKARTDNIVKSDIWYHFKEGFNNAVRRHIYMADLL